MARYRATVETSQAPEEVFAYLSDFSTTADWDPGVVEAQRLDPEVREGARFRVVAKFLGRSSELVYTAIRYEPPRLISLRGENASVISLDTIEVQALPGGGAQVSYDAKLTLKGPARIADPLLGLAFKPVGDRALAGLWRQLNDQ